MGKINIAEKDRETGVKGWTAKGAWESAETGDAFVEEGTGWLYVVAADEGRDRIIVEFDECGELRAITDLDFFEDIVEGVLIPATLNITWRRD